MTDEHKPAVPGAEPGKDGTKDGAKPSEGQKGDTPTPDEILVDDKGKPLPWDQQPKWKAARAAEKKLQDLLKANDAEDVEDLIDLIQSGKKVHGKQVDLDKIDEIVKKAATLDKYEEHWAREKELRQRGEEAPDKTIERLENEIRKLKSDDAGRKRMQEEADEAKRSVRFYESSVKDLLDEHDIPKERRAMLSEFLGIGNESNDIDITDKKAIKRIFKGAAAKLEQFEQEVIQRYLKGKGQVPPVQKAGEPPVQDEKKPRNLKEAREMAKDQIAKKGGLF